MEERGPYHEILRRLDSFDVEAEVIKAASYAEQEIIDLNIHDQLYEQGIRNTGTFIQPGYKKETVLLKQEKGQRTDHVTLRDSEAYQASVYVVFDQYSFELKASDWKDRLLKKKYGKTILGLTTENIHFLIDKYIRKNLQREFRNKIIYGSGTN